MRNSVIPLIIVFGLSFTAGCGVLSTPEPPPPAPTATDSPIQATPLSELPPTWTPTLTLTPTITFTPSPTSPPPTATPNYTDFDIQAMMTPAAASFPEQLPATNTWTLAAGQTATIRIPPEFEVLDLGESFGQLMGAFVEAFAAGMTEFAEDLGQELGATPLPEEAQPEDLELPPFDFLIAVDETELSAIIFTSAESTPETTTESLINQALTDAEGEFQLIGREVISNAPLPTERVTLSIEDPELGTGKQVIYAVVSEIQAWVVIFSAPEAAFESYLPLIEASVNSLEPR